MLASVSELAGHLERNQRALTVTAENVGPVPPRGAHGLDSARRYRFHGRWALRLPEPMEMHGVERVF